MRSTVAVGSRSSRVARTMDSMRALCFADEAAIWATYDATLAKMVAFIVAPMSTTSEEKNFSRSVTGPTESPITIIRVV